MEVKKCRTTLLEDDPVGKDAFGSPEISGPHERVADALVELIESTKEGGKLIGLEGTWGAGKSTVVKLIRGKLEKATYYKDSQVITFDAWAHEGDPLRRTYLETLIRQLQVDKWVDEKRWDDKLDEIAHRRREQIVRNIPHPTIFGSFLALSALLVPVGTVCLREMLSDQILLTFGRGLPVYWTAVFACLALGPIAVVLLKALHVLLTGRRSNPPRKFWSAENWAFLEGKAISTTTTETVETPNPTSLEFEGYFDDLMEEALRKETRERVIIILDNMDRVDPKSALQVWSTLQPFLQHDRRREKKWFKRLWVIVPYDPVGLRGQWTDRAVRKDAAATDISLNDTAESFLDKAFAVRFVVPPLVMSDWRAYLNGLLAEALPDHPVEHRHEIFQVFDHCHPRGNTPPTPRGLKKFVNQIGAIHRQWSDTFPIAHVAYFVLACRDRQEFIANLREGDPPSKIALSILKGDVHGSLAGLAFNLPAERGRETLLAGPIEIALVEGEPETLKELAKVHGDGFWATLEHVVLSRLRNVSGAAVAKSAAAIETSMLLTDATRLEAVNVRNKLCEINASMDSSQWGAFGDVLVDGFIALCRLGQSPQNTEAVLRHLRAVLTHKDAQPVEPGALVDGACKVLAAAGEAGAALNTFGTLEVPIDANGWRAACQWLIKHDTRFWGMIKPQAQPTEVLTILSGTVTSGQFTAEDLPMLILSYTTQKDETWNTFMQAFAQRLNANQTAEAPDVENLLVALWTLRSRGQVPTKLIDRWMKDGHAMHYFSRPAKKGNVRGQAIFILTFLHNRPDGENGNTIGNAAGGYQRFTQILATPPEGLAKELADLAREFGVIEWIFACIQARGTFDMLLKDCLRHLALQESGRRLLPATTILEQWEAFEQAFSADENGYRYFLQAVGSDTDLLQRIREHEFAMEQAVFYCDLVEANQDTDAAFLTWCAQGLQSLDQVAWASDLAGPLGGCELLLSLRQHGVLLELDVEFMDALVAHATEIVQGKALPPEDWQRAWPQLSACLRSSIRQEFVKRLVRLATRREGKLAAGFFHIYGAIIADREALSANDEVVSQLFSEGVKTDKPIEWLQWIARVLKEQPQFWETVEKTSAAEEFKLRLQARIAAPADDDARAALNAIAAAVGVEPPPADATY